MPRWNGKHLGKSESQNSITTSYYHEMSKRAFSHQNNASSYTCNKYISLELKKNGAVNRINPLTPNDPYSGRTAPLTSKRYILYIYSTNIGTE